MPDISMCSDTDCPSREKCYRFMAQPSEFMQSWGSFGVLRGSDEKCSYFWPAEGKRVRSLDRALE
jgi:hypothetical protein